MFNSNLVPKRLMTWGPNGVCVCARACVRAYVRYQFSLIITQVYDEPNLKDKREIGWATWVRGSNGYGGSISAEGRDAERTDLGCHKYATGGGGGGGSGGGGRGKSGHSVYGEIRNFANFTSIVGPERIANASSRSKCGRAYVRVPLYMTCATTLF